MLVCLSDTKYIVEPWILRLITMLKKVYIGLLTMLDSEGLDSLGLALICIVAQDYYDRGSCHGMDWS